MTRFSYGWLKTALTFLSVAFLVIFVNRTWHWPLVADASLMHYDVFMMDHGFAPYSQIIDPNMPGTFLIEGTVVHLFGGGDLTWRIFDLLLLAAAGAAMVIIALPYDWFAGAFAATVFALIHGRDGVIQLGQRDLVMTVLLLWGYVFLFWAMRSRREGIGYWLMAFFGVCIAAAGTIKPTAFLWAIVLLALTAITLQRHRRPFWRRIAFAMLGMALPCAVVLRFLMGWHATAAFADTVTTLVPALTVLGRRSFLHLLGHSISSTMLPLFFLWIPVAYLRKDRWSFERSALIAGFVLGLISFYVQRKGYPYHRYPSEAFLLLVMSIDFSSALKEGAKLRSLPYKLALCGMVLGIVVVGGGSLVHALGQDRHNQEFDTMLRADLTQLGGNRLSGKVQCVDSNDGCIAALYNMRLVQNTGFIYDCYFLSAELDAATENRYRDEFWKAISAHPPSVFVVSSDECARSDDLYRYDKLNRWPLLNSYLSTNYRLYADRIPPHLVNWGSSPSRPLGYRIYVRSH